MTISSETPILERRYVSKGTKIIRQGETGDSAFLVQSGMVRVFVQHEDRQVELAKLGPGQIFGEMALVFDEKRSATVEALDDSNLIVITRHVLNEKLRKTDPTIRAIVPMLMKRIIQSNNAVLSRHEDVQTMLEVVKNIYAAVHSSLPRVQQQTFQNAVLPKLEQFLDAVRAFEEKYSEKLD